MKKLLDALAAEGNLRFLKDTAALQKYIYSGNKQYLNFSSNDYLGLSDVRLQREFFAGVDPDEFLMGNPSSRLLTGNSVHYAELEQAIASLFGKEAALVAGSGFLLNSGVLPAITTGKDLVVADKLVHASIIDGLRLCKCKWTRFRHNDPENLRAILRKTPVEGTVYIVTESVFSMDGDVAPLRELAALKKEFGAKLYVDEAHAFGVRGKNGCGIAEETGLLPEIDYLVATLGKALASQGGFVVCDRLSREVLVNRMRTLIFSTAMPSVSLLWSRFLIEKLPSYGFLREKLARNVVCFAQALADGGVGLLSSETHILPLPVGDNNKALALAEGLKDDGIWVSAIRYPTVPKGTARLRLSVTASFDPGDLCSAAGKIRDKMINISLL